MFKTLDNTCGATEWERVDTVCDLVIILLSPLELSVACAVGRFLSEYLAAREILFVSPPFCESPTHLSTSRWVGGRTGKLNELRTSISESLDRRSRLMSPLPKDSCLFANTWIILHSRETLDDAFKCVRSWLPNGWDSRLDKKNKASKRSVARV